MRTVRIHLSCDRRRLAGVSGSACWRRRRSRWPASSMHGGAQRAALHLRHGRSRSRLPDARQASGSYRHTTTTADDCVLRSAKSRVRRHARVADGRDRIDSSRTDTTDHRRSRRSDRSSAGGCSYPLRSTRLPASQILIPSRRHLVGPASGPFRMLLSVHLMRADKFRSLRRAV